MSVEEYIAKLESDRDLIERAVEPMCNEIAESLLTLIKDRSINEGISINGDESQKATYSTRPTKTEKFKKKVLNSRGSAYLASNQFGTWKEFRQAQGLPGDPVNLAYTNQMWSSIQVQTTSKTAYGKAQTTVGSYDKEANEKMYENTERFGYFLLPTEDEVKMATDVVHEKIIKLLRQ